MDLIARNGVKMKNLLVVVAFWASIFFLPLTVAAAEQQAAAEKAAEAACLQKTAEISNVRGIFDKFERRDAVCRVRIILPSGAEMSLVSPEANCVSSGNLGDKISADYEAAQIWDEEAKECFWVFTAKKIESGNFNPRLKDLINKPLSDDEKYIALCGDGFIQGDGEFKTFVNMGYDDCVLRMTTERLAAQKTNRPPNELYDEWWREHIHPSSPKELVEMNLQARAKAAKLAEERATQQMAAEKRAADRKAAQAAAEKAAKEAEKAAAEAAKAAAEAAKEAAEKAELARIAAEKEAYKDKLEALFAYLREKGYEVECGGFCGRYDPYSNPYSSSDRLPDNGRGPLALMSLPFEFAAEEPADQVNQRRRYWQDMADRIHGLSAYEFEFEALKTGGGNSAKPTEKEGLELAEAAVSWIKRNGAPELFNPQDPYLNITIHLLAGDERRGAASLGLVEYSTVRDAFAWRPAQVPGLGSTCKEQSLTRTLEALAPLESNLNKAFKADDPKAAAAALKALYAYIDGSSARYRSLLDDQRNTYTFDRGLKTALETRTPELIEIALSAYKEQMAKYDIKNAYLCHMREKDYEIEFSQYGFQANRAGELSWNFKAKIPSGGFFSPNPKDEGIKIIKLTMAWLKKNVFSKTPAPKTESYTVVVTTDKKGDTGKTREDLLGMVVYDPGRDAFVWHKKEEVEGAVKWLFGGN